MSDTELQEARLREALRQQADDVEISSDAWQQNQRRLRADASVRGWRALGAAAAALVLVAGVSAVTLLGGNGDRGAPGSGSEDAFDSSNILGEIVAAETGRVDGERTVHEIVLTDPTGDGPQLCDRYLAESSASGGCTLRSPGADKAGVAFDWLAQTEAVGDLRGVVAGVDERASFVRVWMDTGESMPATLHPTGWDGTRMFAVTVDPAKDSAPQRMVASGRDGNVLEAVDLPSRFGDGWLTSRSACAGGGGATWIDPEVQREVSVELGTSDAVISVGERQECLSQLRRTALAGWHAAGSLVVAVVAPETATVRLADGDQVVDELKPFTVPGSLWQVATFRAADPSQLPRVELVALDRHGQELDREFVSQPSTP